MLGKGPQHVPGLLKPPTAPIVIFPDSQEKEEKVALLVFAAAGKFEDLGAKQHDNRKPCVVLTSSHSLTAIPWAAQSWRAKEHVVPTTPNHPAQQWPGSTTGNKPVCGILTHRVAAMVAPRAPLWQESSSRERGPFTAHQAKEEDEHPATGIPSSTLVCATGHVPRAGLHPLLLMLSSQ